MTQTRTPDRYSLVADIGGTNTRVALCEGPDLLPDTIRRYRNSQFPGLDSVIRQYFEDEGRVDCAGACVAAAGPVRDGVAAMTNLDWTIDGGTLARATGAERVAILNDLQAQGHALGRIAPDNLNEVVPGHAGATGDMLVVGCGTGFNAAPVHAFEGGRYVAASEAGHANMPIRTEAELRLCQFVETAHGFPAVEDVLSGRGLSRIYLWLGNEAGDPVEKTSADIVAGIDNDSDPRAVEAGRLFTRILGTVCGNLTLIHLPFGGVFLIGGMTLALAPHFERFGFRDAFRDKGRFAGFMQNFSVTCVEDDYAALTGCAAHLAEIG